MIFLRNIEDRAIANRANRKSQDRRLHHRGDRNIAGRRSLMFVKVFPVYLCDMRSCDQCYRRSVNLEVFPYEYYFIAMRCYA